MPSSIRVPLGSRHCVKSEVSVAIHAFLATWLLVAHKHRWPLWIGESLVTRLVCLLPFFTPIDLTLGASQALLSALRSAHR